MNEEQRAESKKECDAVRAVFKDVGIEHYCYYNDKSSSSRQRRKVYKVYGASKVRINLGNVFEATKFYAELCQMLENKGYKGWVPYYRYPDPFNDGSGYRFVGPRGIKKYSIDPKPVAVPAPAPVTTKYVEINGRVYKLEEVTS
jgi:hypothetical protein